MTASSSPKKSLRSRIREQTSTALLEAVEDVAARGGLESATMAAIAEHAGIAVGTLYNYFPDRDSLLSGLFKHRREEIVPRIAAIARQGEDLPFERRLETYLAAVLTVFDDYRKFIRIALEVDQARIKIKGKPLMVTVVAALEEMLRPIAPTTYERLARMIVGAMKNVVHWRVERDEPAAPDANLIARTFTRGIKP